MNSYENVQRRPLKLKPNSTIRKKGKKLVTVLNQGKTAETKEVTKVIETEDRRTEAERKFEEKKKAREEEKLKLEAQSSYRSRVEKFNQQLMKEPEHFDVPKICPTK
eukprot:jgi/Galph1/5785/GphlegSOOS_G4447.1